MVSYTFESCPIGKWWWEYLTAQIIEDVKLVWKFWRSFQAVPAEMDTITYIHKAHLVQGNSLTVIWQLMAAVGLLLREAILQVQFQIRVGEDHS